MDTIDNESKGNALAKLGYVLSDSTRTRILLALLEEPSYPSELAEHLDISRQRLSNHLACLKGCGLVTSTPEGRRTRYELADPRLTRGLNNLVNLSLSIDPEACATTNELDCC
ncbi:ArsR/SmtB family transcription factor [Haloglycomyces albus]|uniref:ArsR/SmtB family transcription factor n=1 Tax=Haloglycomyces albus TaxID=526067 RepID=UPI00046D5659|nr:metalloregulator ArsR/SmtB family transcription factor [Haloglycomyces albus]